MPTFANINTGTAPNDGTGDSLRESFRTTNNNFSILNSIVADSGNITANIISTGISTFEQLDANVINVQTLGNAGTLITGNVVTAAQPNITSLGNLTSLQAAGTVQFDGTFAVNSDSNFNGNLNTQSNLNIEGGYNAGITFTVANTYAVTNNDYIIVANISAFGNTDITLPNANAAVGRIYKVFYWDPDASATGNILNVGATPGGGNIFITGNTNTEALALSEIDSYCEVISIGDYWFRSG